MFKWEEIFLDKDLGVGIIIEEIEWLVGGISGILMLVNCIICGGMIKE